MQKSTAKLKIPKQLRKAKITHESSQTALIRTQRFGAEIVPKKLPRTPFHYARKL